MQYSASNIFFNFVLRFNCCSVFFWNNNTSFSLYFSLHYPLITWKVQLCLVNWISTYQNEFHIVCSFFRALHIITFSPVFCFRMFTYFFSNLNLSCVCVKENSLSCYFVATKYWFLSSSIKACQKAAAFLSFISAHSIFTMSHFPQYFIPCFLNACKMLLP